MLGIILVIVSFSTLGFYLADKKLSVLKSIKRMDKLLEIIILSLESERMTLEEIFENNSFYNDKSTSDFLSKLSPSDFSNVSNIALECGFCTNKTALSILDEVFFVLGKYSSDEQIKEISFCRNKLNSFFEKINDEILSKAKLLKYSGFFAGITTAIILI